MLPSTGSLKQASWGNSGLLSFRILNNLVKTWDSSGLLRQERAGGWTRDEELTII